MSNPSNSSVVRKRVVLADVLLYRKFLLFTVWFSYVFAVRRGLSPQGGRTQTQVFSMN